MAEADSSLAEQEAGLYKVVPERFVSARDQLARRMRAGGDKAGAARVAKLRRPPLTTWALSQVARSAPEFVEDLHLAGGELRAAMQRALEGDASALRPAQSAERAAVDAVVTEAATRLVRSGYSLTDVMRSRMAETLRAAIVDESVAQGLRTGTLERDHDAPGFGLDASSLPLAAPGSTAPTAAPVSQDSAEGQKAQPGEGEGGKAQREEAQREAARRLSAEADRMAGEAQGLEHEAERLAAEAKRLEAEAVAARDRAAEAQQRAAVAVAAAAAARAEADRALADR